MKTDKYESTFKVPMRVLTFVTNLLRLLLMARLFSLILLLLRLLLLLLSNEINEDILFVNIKCWLWFGRLIIELDDGVKIVVWWWNNVPEGDTNACTIVVTSNHNDKHDMKYRIDNDLMFCCLLKKWTTTPNTIVIFHSVDWMTTWLSIYHYINGLLLANVCIWHWR